MKQYVTPTMHAVKLNVEERIAIAAQKCNGPCTTSGWFYSESGCETDYLTALTVS